jgi:hypothetical protein
MTQLLRRLVPRCYWQQARGEVHAHLWWLRRRRRDQARDLDNGRVTCKASSKVEPRYLLISVFRVKRRMRRRIRRDRKLLISAFWFPSFASHALITFALFLFSFSTIINQSPSSGQRPSRQKHANHTSHNCTTTTVDATGSHQTLIQ